MWEALLAINRAELDMSSVQMDGSHTPAWRGGEAGAYQGRKKRKTTARAAPEHAFSDR